MSILVLEGATRGRANTQIANPYEAVSSSQTVVALSAEGIDQWKAPVHLDPSQAWFWTSEWQALEEEASEDIAHGRVTRYENEDEFMRNLDELFSNADI